MNDTIITERYTREIAEKPFSPSGWLCIHPILPLNTLGLRFTEEKDYSGLINSDLITFPPENELYFKLIDESYDFERCLHSRHESPAQIAALSSSDTPVSTRIGSYTFTLSKDRMQEHAKNEDWDGRYYVQFLAQEASRDDVGAGESKRTIVNRYLLKVSDAFEVVGCKSFNSTAEVADVYKNDQEMTSTGKRC